MRFVSVFYLMATAATLSGCAANALDSVSALSSTCQPSATAIACPKPTAAATTNGSGTGTTGTGTTTTTSTNTGNTATLAQGDTTLILEKSVLQSAPGKPGVSKLTENIDPVTGKFASAIMQINTNTADNSAWPIAKTMADYPRGTGTNQGLAWVALGGTYNAYRAYSANAVDEELQVWHFQNSYATQYRDMTGGGADATHQAWSFGGSHTTAAAMPTSGVVNYAGKFGATASTKGYVNAPAGSGQTVDFNNLWRVNGDSAAQANFGTGAFSAVLTPKNWIGQNLNNDAFVEVDMRLPGYNPLTDPNYHGFMTANINLKGTITGNSIAGTSQFDTASGLVTNTSTNPMYGGFFGPTANEVTGNFALDAMDPIPYGGFSPINNDRRAYIQMSGIYNAQ